MKKTVKKSKNAGKAVVKDEFAERYNKEGNRFVLVTVEKPIPDPDDPRRVHFVRAKVQLCVMPDGTLAGRLVS